MPHMHETFFYFAHGIAKLDNFDLSICKDEEWTEYGGNKTPMFDSEMQALVDWIEGRESKITTPEAGRKIVEAIELIAKSEILR